MRSFIAAAVLVCLVPTVQAADEENPYKSAAVGDWADYKMTGHGARGTTKMTVIAKDDKQVTIELKTDLTSGKKMKTTVQTKTIDLTKKYNSLGDGVVNEEGVDVKLEKLGEGAEKINVGEREFDTKWTKTRTTQTFNNKTFVTNFKIWSSKDVPLGGMVRMDTTTSAGTTRLELIGSSKK